ncbi:CpaE family protein [Microbacteriaceae bacterium 4G12]
MSRFVLITDDPAFEQRTRDAVGGGIRGDLIVRRDVQLPEAPEWILDQDARETCDVLVFGPGVPLAQAMRLAAVFDVQLPAISLVLAAPADPDLALSAMRSGVRDIVDPTASVEDIRVLLERAGQAAENRRRKPLDEQAPGAGSGRIITVASPKGGVGKTTIATNLAVGLGRIAPMSTVIVDLDTQFGDVATALALQPEHTLAQAVSGAAAQDPLVLKAFLTVHSSSIYALCAPHTPAEGDSITGEHVTRLLTQLASAFTYVVVDTAPGLGEQTLAALEKATDAVLVCGMDVSSVRGLRKEIEVLSELGLLPENHPVAVNLADNASGITIRDIEATVRRPVDVVIPRTRAAAYATNKGEPVLIDKPRDGASRALKELITFFDPSAPDRRRTHRRAVLR